MVCNVMMVAVAGAAAVGCMGKARPRGTAAVKTTIMSRSPRQNRLKMKQEKEIN